MNQSKRLGMLGEAKVNNFIKKLGWEVLEKNYKIGRAEIDIIALDSGTYVFCEVKTRQNDFFDAPENNFRPRQEKRIADAASAYMIDREINANFRFDLFAVIAGKNFAITHYKDAFFPGSH